MADLGIKLLWGFIVLLSGAAGQRVNYPPNVCAVTGSTVTLPCTFTPNTTFIDNGRKVRIKIIRVRWCQHHAICNGQTSSVYDSISPNAIPRFKYLGDLEGNCTLQITNINKNDHATLRFRTEVNYTLGNFTGVSGVQVTVVDGTKMRINSSTGDRQTTTGESVTLRCCTVCNFNQVQVVWSKDGRALSESGPTLHLGPLTTNEAGNYTCALKDKKSSLSRPYSLKIAEKGWVPLLVGVMFGCLLALLILIGLLCIIKRKRAANKSQKALEGYVKNKNSSEIYSNILLPSDNQGTSQTVDDVSYASVQFQHKKKCREAQQEEDEAVIYSSVASKG